MTARFCRECMRECQGSGHGPDEKPDMIEDAEVCKRINFYAARVDGMDTESAHRSEDALTRCVLRAIAAGAADPIVAATDMLSILEAKRPRWYS